MITRSVFASILVLMAGCAPSNADRLAEHCVYAGENAIDPYCRTTYIEILSHPALFDGERITIRAWAVLEGDTILIFPFKEYVDAGFANSAIEIVAEGGKAAELEALLAKMEPLDSRKIFVSGRLELARGRRGEGGVVRLGYLHDVDGFGG